MSWEHLEEDVAEEFGALLEAAQFAEERHLEQYHRERNAAAHARKDEALYMARVRADPERYAHYLARRRRSRKPKPRHPLVEVRCVRCGAAVMTRRPGARRYCTPRCRRRAHLTPYIPRPRKPRSHTSNAEIQRRKYARVKADPERYAHYLAAQRERDRQRRKRTQ